MVVWLGTKFGVGTSNISPDRVSRIKRNIAKIILGRLNAVQNCHKIAILPPNFQKKLK